MSSGHVLLSYDSASASIPSVCSSEPLVSLRVSVLILHSLHCFYSHAYKNMYSRCTLAVEEMPPPFMLSESCRESAVRLDVFITLMLWTLGFLNPDKSVLWLHVLMPSMFPVRSHLSNIQLNRQTKKTTVNIKQGCLKC